MNPFHFLQSDFFPFPGVFLVGGVVLFALILSSTSRPAGKTCNRCQERNRPRANFCAQCGEPLSR